MNLFAKVLLPTVLFLSAANAQYIISSFQTAQRDLPSGNAIIAPEEGSTLRQFLKTSIHKRGEMLFRHRFSATEYGLFIGKMNDSAALRLFGFKLPQLDRPKSLVLKYYTKPVTTPEGDVEDVYFCNGFIYVTSPACLFYNDSGWRSLDREKTFPIPRTTADSVCRTDSGQPAAHHSETGVPLAVGGRTKASINAVVMVNMPALKDAYNKRLREKNGIRGQIKIKFVIDEHGVVVYCAVVESTMEDEKLESMLVEKIRTWRFEKIDISGDITEVVYPFIFSQ